MINILFELIMRYCDYTTFKICSTLSKECNRLCRKLVSELRKIKKCNYYYQSHEVFWNNKRQGLVYYVNENYLKIIDYDNGKVIATYVYNVMSEHITLNKDEQKKYKAKMNFKDKKVYLSKIPGYFRHYLSLAPIADSHFFN